MLKSCLAWQRSLQNAGNACPGYVCVANLDADANFQNRRAIASAIMIVVTLVGADTMSGMIEASTT
jgi:hypothetical protein